MGTNYYLYSEERNKCECCGRADPPEELHIGKSSAGWCFSLHTIPSEGLASLEAWEQKWNQKGWHIKDEYGKPISPAEMRRIITERGREKPSLWTAQDYQNNHAQPGPNNLVRHRLGPYCVGHGEGTWDLIPGEFS